MTPIAVVALCLVVAGVLLGTVGCASIQRALLFHPTHRPPDSDLAPWIRNGEVYGYARQVDSPESVWLMLHGNGGQASDRTYALPCFSARDAVYILEYPGYGNRPGVPSKAAFDRAAEAAYRLLRETYPATPICVAAESIGSGPAASLSRLAPPPDKLVLIVPFDTLASVAKDHFPSLLVSLLLTDDWDNIEALSSFAGPVEIVGAEEDTIIPVRHAWALAAAVPGSKLTIVGGGHNEWCSGGRVTVRNP
jgi:pimeloyl-ACP methyl ester carboxylesterase